MHDRGVFRVSLLLVNLFKLIGRWISDKNALILGRASIFLTFQKLKILNNANNMKANNEYSTQKIQV